MSYLASVRRLAEDTPSERNRVVDTMRVVSILVVVFGHWTLAAVTYEDGDLVAGHLLELASWTHPLTWLFQVMPIFFFVGGYANALSWRSARRKGGSYGGWLRERMRRLALPVIPLLIVWGVGGWLAIQAGLDWEKLQLASQVALVPTWFLAAYVVIVTLTPPALFLWERYGWWALVAGLGMAGLADVLDLAGGVVWVGFLNYLFVWGMVHMLGFAWVDGGFASRWRRYATLAVGFVTTLVLVWAGPYPVAMVGLDTAEITNSYPPRVTLAFLGLFQAGLVLVFEPLIQRAAERLRVWMFVVGISALIMTLYLWHLTAMVIVIGGSLAFDGFGLGLEPLTGAWWWSRLIWYVVCGAVTVALMLIFGRFERPSRDMRLAPPWWRPVVAVALVCAGLGLLAAIGIADADGLNGLILSLPLVGVVLGGIVGPLRSQQV